MTRRLFFFLLLACTTATAETGIRTATKMVESRYAVRHHGVPGLWLAKPFMIGSGVAGLNIAEFGKLHVPPEDSCALKQQLSKSLGPEWHPFVEEWSKREGEWSLIYTKTDTDKISMLILTSDPGSGLTVVQMKISPKALYHWVGDPIDSAKHKDATGVKNSPRFMPTRAAKDQTAEDHTDTEIVSSYAAR